MTNFSKNSFYLLPEPLRLGEFLTNYCCNICIIKILLFWYYKIDIIWSQRPIKSYDLSGKLYMCTFLRGDFSRDRRVGHLLSDKIYYARKE
ncbi:hypothetical protein BACCOP_01044 [Phocaeicola coprocola DSM 17136]|uniref:Uncharacterized protein n=5 Tax=Phocaeicola coprocola TaxID=310298 RepID=B3JGP0_9BACT|nr:hypothetical protein BACCOP_03380 [Phocaeicola coprocola DSM 17136]EDV01862.1 hypothetical protein BACCOP_01044 [Phocaeicola coprocola DSM 17136]